MGKQLLNGKSILIIAAAVILLNFPSFFFFLEQMAVDPSLFASAFFIVVAVTLGLITALELRKYEHARLANRLVTQQQTRRNTVTVPQPSASAA